MRETTKWAGDSTARALVRPLPFIGLRARHDLLTPLTRAPICLIVTTMTQSSSAPDPTVSSAAIVIAQTGRSVLVLEGQPTIGGGARSAELTLPGFIHDVGSAVHPLAVGAPFFPSLPLEQHGLEWIHPPAALAHPFDDGPPAMLRTSIEETGRSLGADAERYDRLVRPIADHWDEIAADSLGPLHLPKHPFVMGKFGLSALRSMRALAESRFRGEQARGLMAGLGAHSIMPLTHVGTASIGLVLAAVAHRAGWPSPKGGAQNISNALASYLRSLGGEIVTDSPVASLAELPSARVVLLDLTARNALQVGGDRFSPRYRDALLALSSRAGRLQDRLGTQRCGAVARR